MNPLPPPSDQRFAHFSTISPSIRLVWQASSPLFILLLVLTILIGITPLLTVAVSSRLLALLAHAAIGSGASKSLPHDVVLLLLAMGAISACRGLLGHISESVKRVFQQRVSQHVQGILVERTSAVDIAHFDDPAFRNRLQQASSEAGHRPLAIVQLLMQAASSSTTIVSFGLLVAYWHWWLLPVALVSPLILFRVQLRTAEDKVELTRSRKEDSRESQRLRSILMDASAAKEIRLFNLKDYFLQRLRDSWAILYRQEQSVAKQRIFDRGLMSSLATLDRPVLYGFVASRLFAGQISFGELSFYTQSISGLQNSCGTLTSSLAQLHENHLFVTSLFEFLTIDAKLDTARTPSSAHALSEYPEVECRDVWFRYTPDHDWVLKGVSFKIQSGEVIALAGLNGSGKSTLVKLLAGLYAPVRGKITLDGIDIQEMDISRARSCFSMVFQDFKIYEFTVQENIAVGQISRLNDQTAIRAAAVQTGFDPIVSEMPYGYETILGRHAKHGHELAGGQRQLVALTRSHFRKAPIIVMDEPTAALDVHNERRLFEKILKQRQDPRQTLILITHRMAAIRQADRILVLSNGQLVEDGDHQKLAASGGCYADMVNAQMR